MSQLKSFLKYKYITDVPLIPTYKHFSDRLPMWIEAASSVKDVVELIESGFAKKEHFGDRFKTLIEEASVDEAKMLIENRLAEPDDFTFF